MTVLIASCIRQKPEILREFLESLDKLEKLEHEYFFILSDLEDKSKELFDSWSQGKPVETLTMDYGDTYVCDEDTHHWDSKLVSNVIEMKEKIIERAGDYDRLLLVDSDTYLHPETLIQLLSRQKDIITEISWTKWTPESPEMPNAWFKHPYDFSDDGLLRLRRDELLKVAGFGGLYLISSKAIKAGVNFSRVDGLPDEYWGEDRHFAVRANSLGFGLWVDTVFPSFHIYRLSDLPRLKSWKVRGFKFIEKPLTVQSGTVLIAICVGEKEIHKDTTAWLVKTIRDHPDWGLEISRGHPVDSNRNSVAKKFSTLPEAQRFEWVQFVDSDVVPPDGAVERLLSRGKKIIGGVCLILGRDGFPIPNFAKDIGSGHLKADRVLEVKGMGTGFMLIHRDVLKAVGKSPFRYQYDEWGIASVSGEDYDFCAKAAKAGFKTYTDLTVQCEHYKNIGIMGINKLLEKVAKSVAER